MIKPSILILAALCATPLCAASISITAAGNSLIDEAGPDTVWQDWGTIHVVNYMPGQERSDLFKFNLASLPAGATITGAKLWLSDTGWNDLATQSLYWHPDSSWDPATVTWNTFSMASNSLVGAVHGVSGWQYNAWNIDLAAWNWAADVSQGAATFQLRVAYGNFFPNQNDFHSLGNAQSSVRPYLELEYSEGGAAQTPEPGTMALLGAGLVALAVRVRRTPAAKRPRQD